MKKNIFLTALLLMIAMMTQAQNLNNFFDKYADDERFSYTKIGKNMQTLTLDITPENKALAESIEKEILEIMKKDNYEQIVASREKGERSYIYSLKDEKTNMSETVIINRDKNEINILWTKGNKKNKMLGSFDFQGLQSLDVLQNLGELQILGELQNLGNFQDLGNIQDLPEFKPLDKLKDIKMPTFPNPLKDNTDKSSTNK